MLGSCHLSHSVSINIIILSLLIIVSVNLLDITGEENIEESEEATTRPLPPTSTTNEVGVLANCTGQSLPIHEYTGM